MPGALHDKLESLKDQLEAVDAGRVKSIIILRKSEERSQDLARELADAGGNLQARQSLQKELNQSLKDQDRLKTQIRKQKDEVELLTREIEAAASKLVAERAVAMGSKNLRLSKVQIDLFFLVIVCAAVLAIVTWFVSHDIVSITIVIVIVIVAGYLLSWAIKRKLKP